MAYEKYENLKALYKAAVETKEVPIADLEAAIVALEQRQEAVNQITVLDQLEETRKISATRRIRIEARLENIDAGGIRRLGKYRMLGKIGQGKMGAVYEAEDTTSGQKFAVKVLPKEARKNRQFAERFKREIRISMSLQHPTIVRCYDFGELDGFLYYAMEVLKGRTLKSLTEKGPVKPAVAARYTLELADGLGHAHAAGIIHRDIKPENLFLTDGNVVKILDLGLSKNIEKEEKFAITMEGTALGTPYYMSPEQSRGHKDIDGRTDIYALGGTFFTLLTGEVPFPGKSMTEVMLKHNTEKLRDPRMVVPEIPETMVRILHKMMEKDPAHRYQSCAELEADLEAALNPPPKPPPEPAVRQKVQDTARRGTAVKKKRSRTEENRTGAESKASASNGTLGWILALLVVLLVAGVVAAHYGGLIQIAFLP